MYMKMPRSRTAARRAWTRCLPRPGVPCSAIGQHGGGKATGRARRKREEPPTSATRTEGAAGVDLAQQTSCPLGVAGAAAVATAAKTPPAHLFLASDQGDDRSHRARADHWEAVGTKVGDAAGENAGDSESEPPTGASLDTLTASAAARRS